MSNYEKTVAAFLAEEGSLWNICDALAEEVGGPATAGEIGECQARLAEHGIERKASTIEFYIITGRYVAAATPTQQRVLRGQSVTTIRDLARYGATHEFAVETIKRYQAETGKTRVNPMHVRRLFAEAKAQRTSGTPASPEEWTPAQWEAFDKKVSSAVEVVLDAFLFRRNGWYVPSVEATASLTLLRQDDLDAELAALTREA